MGSYRQIHQKSSTSPLQVATTKSAVPAIRHPAADTPHVVMDSREISPVQMESRI
jgi:hypothetical protein